MSSVRQAIKEQIIAGLTGARFPIKSTEELLAAFPNGAATTCAAGNIRITAGEAGKLLRTEDFPFLSAEQVAETIVSRAGL